MGTGSSRPVRPLAGLVRPVTPLGQDELLADVAARITEAGGGLPVADPDGRLIGYLSERDVLRALFPAYLTEFRRTGFLIRDLHSLLRHAGTAATHRVGNHMQPDPPRVGADDSEAHAGELFLHHGAPSIAVVDADGRVTGMLRPGDLVRAILDACRAG